MDYGLEVDHDIIIYTISVFFCQFLYAISDSLLIKFPILFFIAAYWDISIHLYSFFMDVMLWNDNDTFWILITFLTVDFCLITRSIHHPTIHRLYISPSFHGNWLTCEEVSFNHCLNGNLISELRIKWFLTLHPSSSCCNILPLFLKTRDHPASLQFKAAIHQNCNCNSYLVLKVL